MFIVHTVLQIKLDLNYINIYFKYIPFILLEKSFF